MTRWNEATAERYDQWADSSQGHFALVQEYRLLHFMLSSWPRRKQKLLEIGCGTGFFLQAFWEAGFDVTGIDASPAMLERCRTRLGPRADLHLGSAEHLPFADKEFDFVALITVLEFCDDPESALREALRVAGKGILIGFLNRRSLYFLTQGKPWPGARSSLLRQASWFSPGHMSRLVSRVTDARSISTRSILIGPPSSWRSSPPWKWLNSLILPSALGAFVSMRIDLMAERAMTPLFSFTQTKKVRAESTLQPVASVPSSHRISQEKK